MIFLPHVLSCFLYAYQLVVPVSIIIFRALSEHDCGNSYILRYASSRGSHQPSIAPIPFSCSAILLTSRLATSSETSHFFCIFATISSSVVSFSRHSIMNPAVGLLLTSPENFVAPVETRYLSSPSLCEINLLLSLIKSILSLRCRQLPPLRYPYCSPAYKARPFLPFYP